MVFRMVSSPEDKVLVIVGDATETVDTLYPYFRLQEAGFAATGVPDMIDLPGVTS